MPPHIQGLQAQLFRHGGTVLRQALGNDLDIAARWAIVQRHAPGRPITLAFEAMGNLRVAAP